MPYLLLIADDFTGALDASSQLASAGARTVVKLGADADWSGTNADVVVIDAETRHLPRDRAYETVLKIVRQAAACSIPHIFKKTDSALRGNVGAELAAVLDGTGERFLPFLPAMPQLDRTTAGGVHYIAGVPVAESVFGADPFEPVRFSAVVPLLQSQTDIPAASLGTNDAFPPDFCGIAVFDAATLDDLRRTALHLKDGGAIRVMAGCAGLGAILPELIPFRKAPVDIPKLGARLLVICGSVNAITRAQLDAAEQAGFYRLRLLPEQTLRGACWDDETGEAELVKISNVLEQHPRVIVDTNDIVPSATADYAARYSMDLSDVRVRVSRCLGELAGRLARHPALGTLFVTGGDTLLQVVSAMGIRELEPICELDTGVVLSRFDVQDSPKYIISKSGGFGDPQLLVRLVERLEREEKGGN